MWNRWFRFSVSGRNVTDVRAMKDLILKLFGLIVCVALAGAPVCGQTSSSVTVVSSVDRNRITLGELVTWTVEVEWPEGIRPPVVDPGRKLGDFEVVNARSDEAREIAGVGGRQTHAFELTVYDTGSHDIPPLDIKWRSEDGATTGVVSTAVISIQVPEMEGLDEAADVREARGPVEMVVSTFWRNVIILSVPLVIGLVALLIWYLRRRARMRPERTEPEIPRPIAEVALERLAELAARLPETDEEAMVFYVELTEVIRVFIGKRYGFEAMERTTSEIGQALRIRAVSKPAGEAVTEFLNDCDMVKFAKAPADRDTASTAVETARAIVQVNRPVMTGNMMAGSNV